MELGLASDLMICTLPLLSGPTLPWAHLLSALLLPLLPSSCPPLAPVLAELGQCGSGLLHVIVLGAQHLRLHLRCALWLVFDHAGMTQAICIGKGPSGL